MDITTALAEAKRPERTVNICLRGDLLAQFETAEAELGEIEKTNLLAPSLADGGRRRELAEELDRLRQEMLANSVEFRFRGVARRAWTQLMAEHPPRQDIAEDRGMGINGDTFFTALIKLSAAFPELTGEQWDALLDETLTSAQFQALADAAWAVNRGSVDVPFSRAALRVANSTERA